MIEGLEADLLLARGDHAGAARAFREGGALSQSLRLLYGEATALIDAGRPAEALALAKAEILTTPDNGFLWELRSRAESVLGLRLAQHRSLGELYAIQGNYAAAAEQFSLAQAAKDGDFFEHSAVDSRLRKCGHCWPSSSGSDASSVDGGFGACVAFVFGCRGPGMRGTGRRPV
jgi:predicted Zn-dependent protease